MATMISEVYEAFRSVGIPEDKATAAAKVIAGKENVATKEDLLKTESSMKQEMLKLQAVMNEDLLKLENRLNGRILELESRLNERILEVEKQILRSEKRILLQMGGMFIVAIAVLSTLMKFLQTGATP